jgi:CRP-like cAMP-binding protein
MVGHDKNEGRGLGDLLRGFQTFAECDDADLSALVAAGGHFSLPAGWPLVQEGIPADCCYVITAGTARVFHQRQQIAEVGPGDFVGESALLHGTLRSATVTSSTHIEGLRIDNQSMATLLAKLPHLSNTLRTVEAAHSGPTT